MVPASPQARPVGYRAVVFAAVFTALALDLPLFLYSADLGPPPKYYFALAVAATLPCLIGMAAGPTWRIAGPFILWSLGVMLLTAVTALVAPASQGDVVVTRAFNGLLAVYLAVVMGATPAADIARAVRWAASLAMLSIALSFLLPDLFMARELPGAVLGRAAGFWVNPNRAAEATLLLSVAATCTAGRRMRLLLLGVAGLCVLLTFSRGALVIWAAVVVALAALGTIPRIAVVIPALFFAVLASVGILLGEQILFSLEQEAGAANVLERIEGLIGLEAFDFSALERFEAARLALDAFSSHPLTGLGIGSMEFTFGISPHNQLLQFAAEYGVFGTIAFVWLLILIFQGSRLRLKADRFVMLLATGGLSIFTHNMLDSLYWLLALILASQRAGGDQPESRRRLQSCLPPRTTRWNNANE